MSQENNQDLDQQTDQQTLVLDLTNTLANNSLFNSNNPYQYINKNYKDILNLIDIYNWNILDESLEYELFLQVEITPDTFEKMATLIHTKIHLLINLVPNKDLEMLNFDNIIGNLMDNPSENITDYFKMLLFLYR